jgi:thiosulfate/3-mercaptopyruvate sulfurtransferase
VILGVILLAGVFWSLGSVGSGNAKETYPNGHLLATAGWLKKHIADPDLLIVDVRTDKHFDGKVIPGAVRLPWSDFRYDNTASNTGSLFVGVERAQEILGAHGIGRTQTLVLYDNAARDGGATASYVFWVLDVLGHDNKRVLEGGIDAWARAGYDLDARPAELSAILYQAPMDEIRSKRLIDGNYVYRRLGDPFYQIIDVRSRDEYLGNKGTRDLRGNALKLGHIPTAVNVNYEDHWVDKETKLIKPYGALQALYPGIDPDRGIIVYCNSGRRSSFSYYMLRLMGMANVATYEASWKQWGNPAMYYPVETVERTLAGTTLPGASTVAAAGAHTGKVAGTAKGSSSPSTDTAPKGGYVSCGG